jgi:hypothetical protein
MSGTSDGGRQRSGQPRRASGRAAGHRPTSRAEALEILLSAVGYCQAAGFEVRAGNRDDAEGRALLLVIPGAQCVTADGADGRETRFEPVVTDEAPSQPPPAA